MPAPPRHPHPERPRPHRRGPRHLGGFAAHLSVLVALGACGGPPPLPPAPTQDFDRIWPTARDGVRGALTLRDRSLLRTGYACADCHPVPGGEVLRGAPDLAGLATRPGPFWTGTSPTISGAIARCAARFGATPMASDFPMGDLLLALAATPDSASAPVHLADDRTPAPATLPTAATDWDRACAHCHDLGPAPRLHGRPWPTARMVDTVRHTDRPLHPSSLMPVLMPALLDDERLAAIAAALEAGDLQNATTSPEVGKPAVQ